MTKGQRKKTLKAGASSIRGTGKYGYGEGSKLHTTMKRFAATFEDENQEKGKGKAKRKKPVVKEVEQMKTYTSAFKGGVTVKVGDTIEMKLGNGANPYGAVPVPTTVTRKVKMIFNDLVNKNPNNPECYSKRAASCISFSFPVPLGHK